VSGVAVSTPTSAPIQGPRWGARAADWAQLAAPVSVPAWKAVAEATGIGEGTRVLDVGCGSGEFCRLAAARGALVSGIDAAEGMIEIARGLVPDADLRIGPMERLPWDDEGFDVVTGFNAFQFAADMLAALTEAKRVARPGGQVAICNWGRPEKSGLVAIMGALRGLQPPPPPGAGLPEPPPLGQPGVLEALALEAGLEPAQASEVDVPFEAPDEEMLVRALLAPGGTLLAVEHSGEGTVRKAIRDASAAFRRPDGSYRIENTFRYLIART
jgi:SAM-dependent methyltransferase